MPDTGAYGFHGQAHGARYTSAGLLYAVGPCKRFDHRSGDEAGGSVPLHLAVDTTGLKIFGEGGEWLARKHKTKGIRRRWPKLHLGLELASGKIVCADLTHDGVGDTTALRTSSISLMTRLRAF